METPEFANLSIVGKVLYTRHAFLILLMLIPINSIINRKIKRKTIKIPIMIILIAYCLVSIIQNLQYEFPILDNVFILNSKIITVPFWIIYTILFLYSIIDTYKDNKRKLAIYLMILIIGFSSIFSMFLSPVWGDRISVFNIFCLYIISISLISNIVKKANIEKMEKFLIGTLICACICYLLIFIYIAHIQNIRENEIKQCIDNNEKILNLTKSPIALTHIYNPETDFHINSYKSCYNIPEDVEIRLKSSELELMIINLVKNIKSK